MAATDLTATPLAAGIELHHSRWTSRSSAAGRGLAAAEDAERAGKSVRVLDAEAGEEVVAIYAGPMVVVRTPDGMLHVQPHEIVVATGAAEIHRSAPATGSPGS